MLSNPKKLLILTQISQEHSLHSSSLLHQVGHLPTPAESGAAEIDDAKLAMTARTIAEEKRIICDSCDIGSNDSEEDNTEEDGWLLCAEYCYLKFVPVHICNASRLPAKVASATWYGTIIYWTNS
jgi:hypothetical protein